MWDFIKYSLLGLLIILAVGVIIAAPQILVLLVFIIPYGIGKLYSQRKHIKSPSLDEDTKEAIKKTGKSSAKAVGKAASFTSQKVILPLFKMAVDKLEAKKKYEAHTNSAIDEKAKDDLKDSIKKRESEI